MIASNKTGRRYCFQPDRLYLRAGSDIALLGESQYRLQCAVTRQGDEFYLPEEDGRRILTTMGWALPQSSGAVAVKYYFGDQLGLPLFQAGDILVVGLDGTQPDIPKKELRKRLWTMSEKHIGELRRAIWQEEAGRINSYRLYVPTGWYAAPTGKMLVCLHGSASNEDVYFARSGGKLSFLAEKYGYLVLAPNSFVLPSNYGGPIPPSGLFAAPRFFDDAGNPQYYPLAELEENALAERCVMQVVEAVVREFGVDTSKVALTGNSMGGIGTFHLGAKYKLFGALCPCGALPEPTVPNWADYGQKPILFVAGTEDHNSFEKMVEDSAYIQKQGVNLRLHPVGGGVHADAWVWALPEIFEFFEANLNPSV